jgi:hypothetical protein
MKDVCMNCQDRYVGCHSKCSSYKAFRDQCDIIIKKRASESKLRGILIEMTKRGLKQRQI